MDITFKTAEGKFNFRVAAVIIHDEKLLVMQNTGYPYYCLPGGRVNLHEQAEDAILRELQEELNICAKIDRALWLHQNFFTEKVNGEAFHEIGLYYLMNIQHTDLLGRGEKFQVQEGNRWHPFVWLPFSKMKDAPVYPLFIKERVYHLPETLQCLVTYGGETKEV